MLHRLPFGVNHYLCPGSMGVQDFLGELSGRGFQCIGLTEAALQEIPASDMRRELREHGLGVSSVNTAGFFLQEGERDQAQTARNKALLQRASELDGAALNVIVGGSKTLALPVARDLVADRLAAFAQEAAGLGVQLMLEPLHFLNVRTTSCVNTIAQSEWLFDRIPGLALNVDLFHLWWDPDLDRLLRGDSVPIALLQICDVAIAEGDQIPRRVPLGEGFVSWAEYVHAVRKAFPMVPIELELFADQLPGRRVEDILTASAAALSTL